MLSECSRARNNGVPSQNPSSPHICQTLHWAVGSSVYGNGRHERWEWRVGGGFLRKMCLTLSKISFMVAGFRSFEFKLLLLLPTVSNVRVIPSCFDHLLYATHCAKKGICIISFNPLTNPLRLVISWMRKLKLGKFNYVSQCHRASKSRDSKAAVGKMQTSVP